MKGFAEIKLHLNKHKTIIKKKAIKNKVILIN